MLLRLCIPGILIFAACFVPIAFGLQRSAAAEAIDNETVAEIEHLIDYVGRSELTFIRNWRKYDSLKAEDHIRLKYDFLVERGMISSIDDFIFWTATRSYLTGQAYKVRLQSGETVPVESWLREELERYQAERTPE